MSYENRLRTLNLPTLAFRRLRGDVIEVFIVLQGIYDPDTTHLFQLSDVTVTRGNSKKLFKPRARLNVRKFFFTHRVIDSWNSLPDNVVEAESLNSFKNMLDKLWENHPLKYDYTYIFA